MTRDSVLLGELSSLIADSMARIPRAVRRRCSRVVSSKKLPSNALSSVGGRGRRFGFGDCVGKLLVLFAELFGNWCAAPLGGR